MFLFVWFVKKKDIYELNSITRQSVSSLEKFYETIISF